MNETPALCVLAAGRGSRLGQLTAQINKALLPVGRRAAITRIIDRVPEGTPLVIAVGYEGDKLREYCEAVYPEHEITFVPVDNLAGAGSGPGYSLLQCAPHLQRPFWLVNVDTLVDDLYPELDENWLGIARDPAPGRYATVAFDEQWVVTGVQEKGQGDAGWAYIGVAGIQDWEPFWAALAQEAQRHGAQPELQYLQALASLRLSAWWSHGWHDTGSPEGYARACQRYREGEPLGLEKTVNEITYADGDLLVKLCWDQRKNERRALRARDLAGLVPELCYVGEYVTAYPWVAGETLARSRDLSRFAQYLDWLQANLWQDRRPRSRADFQRSCRRFYRDKSWQRLRRFWELRGIDREEPLRINGWPCQPVDAYLTYLDWDWLSQGCCSRIHGDLQLDNSLLTITGEFLLIDWREEFADEISMGDRYYDLAKLYGVGIDLPYHRLVPERCDIQRGEGVVWYSVELPSYLELFRDHYQGWLVQHGYDLKKVRTIAALAQLSMAPLHPAPIGDLLYHHATLRLAQLAEQ